MDFLLADILFSCIGRIVLFARYFNRQKVRSILASQYDNSFAQAGRTYAWLFVAGVLMMGFFLMLVAVLISLIRH